MIEHPSELYEWVFVQYKTIQLLEVKNDCTQSLDFGGSDGNAVIYKLASDG